MNKQRVQLFLRRHHEDSVVWSFSRLIGNLPELWRSFHRFASLKLQLIKRTNSNRSGRKIIRVIINTV